MGLHGVSRFDSRVDFFLPLEADVNVKIGDKVITQSVIGEFK